MTTRIAVTLLLLALALPARADHSWSTTDVMLQTSLAAIIVVDWSQTIAFTQQVQPRYDPYARTYNESNPVLGVTPSRARVNTLIPAALLAHTAVAAVLPHGPWRTVWQASWIGVELHAVGLNWAAGVRFATPW